MICVFLCRLQKNYVPPRKSHQQVESAPAAAAAGGSKFSLFKSSSAASSTPPPAPAAAASSAAVAMPPQDPYDPEEDNAERKSVAATVYNPTDLASMGKEQILKSFLGVSVSRGEKYSMENKRVHHAYEVS